MREELKSGNRGIFSQALVDALDEVLEARRAGHPVPQPARHGHLRLLPRVRHVAKCPQCDTPLTLHVDTSEPANVQPASMLTCHRCGYTGACRRNAPPATGPDPRLWAGQRKSGGRGGRAASRLPALLRWDWETTRQKDAHEIILSHFAAHRADVLVGTQMLAKGLDLPLVTLVGIVLADVGLNLPDPFAAERTFSLLTQVAGRAGRSALGGRVVLQTFQPEHYAIQAAARHDVDGFYARELDERRKLGYPPFSRLVRLEYRHFDPLKAETTARELAAKISQLLVSRTTGGRPPSSARRRVSSPGWPVSTAGSSSSRGPDPESLFYDLKLDGWRVEVDPASLL